MTAPRLARASRGRFFAIVFLLLFLAGFIAIFHSSQQQLDESRQLRFRCEQQQEALNARMQAIVEHKFRLEKSLENERKEHIETKENYERKTKEQKEVHAKASLDANVRFDSLQQHYKLLESEHKDLVDECGKTKENHLEQINGLERKVKSLQTQLQQAKSLNEKEVLHWKLKYQNLEKVKDHMEAILEQKSKIDATNEQKNKINKLEHIISQYKSHCAYQPNDDLTVTSTVEDRQPVIEKSFKEQVPVSEDLYKIVIKEKNNSVEMHENINKILVTGANINSGNNALNGRGGSIINSVENFQIIPKLLNNNDLSNNDNEKKVLQQPPEMNERHKSSTEATNANKPLVSPASAASPTPIKGKHSSTQSTDSRKDSLKRTKIKQMPLGVPPVPENFEELIKNDINHSDNNNNNRYANVVNELTDKKGDSEKENVAHEVRDDFNIAEEKSEPKDRLREVLESMNNAAEDDTNNFFDGKILDKPNLKDDGDDDVDMIRNKPEKGDALLDGGEKLINEVVRDHGKEAAFPDGMHLEEPMEEDEDEDDYSNPAARQQEGAAVRN